MSLQPWVQNQSYINEPIWIIPRFLYFSALMALIFLMVCLIRKLGIWYTLPSNKQVTLSSAICPPILLEVGNRGLLLEEYDK